MTKYIKGKIVQGTVTCIEPYGAFMSFDEFYTGLIHISEISKGFVKDIHDFLNVGDHIYVEILDVDEEESHLNLSIKNINYKINGQPRRRKIIETPSGFTTLAKKLPLWINEELKKTKNPANTIDKQSYK
jgi:predicted RNA-binding protein with RPS1 domain